MRLSAYLVVPGATSAVLAATTFPPPPLGQGFQPPSDLLANVDFLQALSSLNASLTSVTQTGECKFGQIGANTTSYSIGLFDTKSILLDFEHSSSTLAAPGTSQVDHNSIYRIGSVSKLLTAYLFLIEAGEDVWDHQVTDVVPELEAAAQSCNAQTDAVDCVDWTNVTLGALASHMAGIAREFSQSGELINNNLTSAQLVASGFPPLNSSDAPQCATNATDPCSREEYFQGVTQLHPVFSPFGSPSYSNVAYQILGYALENITGESFELMFQRDLVGRLGLNGTSYSEPVNSTEAVIPFSISGSAWSYEVGDETPAGGIYSTLADLMRIGQSMLNNEVLSPSTTRSWMKPVAHTASLQMSVGKPWEIIRTSVDGRVVDLYTKSGDVGAYSSMLVIIPDYNAGFANLAAGGDASQVSAVTADLIIDAFLPALEQAAREQAMAKLAGSYRSFDLNSSIELSIDAGKPGLGIKSFISNGSDVIEVDSDIRLYPTGLNAQVNSTTSKASYRAVFPQLTSTGTGVVSQALNNATWLGFDSITYNEIGIDEFLFTLDADGSATSISPRAWESELYREE
ncbi:beta-lactamase/transpeptidase-like protein [Gymnopus androsaceus JB14]|uniref:Beta-lactamase/transpeptidase-like protein n=1 Tax=Gymnopus androsaceus JB14 TaxID=1447944 RepID=A0A6A4I2A3_9AGAR|nr:beta-lactamase/transpeptidase-like protein [Gymnopus androsaceus JB14]